MEILFTTFGKTIHLYIHTLSHEIVGYYRFVRDIVAYYAGTNKLIETFINKTHQKIIMQ